ncbi:hypothetical protein G9A89_011740 [Geosiphon pyriformis]|nr:hypothetical protein G9A89_011740 [Geosiphon pyriformis]
MLANTTMFSDKFITSMQFSDLDAMWDIVCKILVLSVSEVFKKKWFKSFDNVFIKESLRFHKLELLVSKIVKASHEECVVNFESLMGCWISLDNVRASVVQSLVDFGAGANNVCSALFGTRRFYCASKLAKSLRAKKANIRSAIDKRMKNFEMDKVNNIMERWTRKQLMVDDVSDAWSYQYRLLDYVFDETFSGIMCAINFDELHHVVSNLPDGKATGLSGISNELWKHCDESVLGLLLPYEWKGVFTNTHPIALIETAHKILSKILSDRISLACSSYDVLHNDNFSVLKGIATQSPILLLVQLLKTLWRKTGSSVGSSQNATQHILNVAGEFFHINDISINNDKTVAIPINNKQFLYLVSAVLHPIISYRTQFSLVSVGMCNKWDALVHKCLKLKSGLLQNFSSDTIHHPSFYSLKILGHMFSYRSHDLQVLCWQLIYLLIFPTRICVSVSNNFLADVVSILLDCKLFLGGSLASVFQFHGGVPMSVVLGEFLFFKFLPSLRRYGVVFVDQLQDRHSNVFSWLTFKRWKRLDPHGPVSEWFERSIKFLVVSHSSPSVLVGVGPVNICGFDDFVSVCDCLSWVNADSLTVYTDGSLKNLGTTGCKAGTAVFFEDINLGLGISVWGLVLSTLAELQAIVLALKCVPVACSVCLFSDSQAALDACMSEVDLVYSNFHNWCWVECWHIKNVICSKNLRISWHKVKNHSGVLGNDRADSITNAATFYNWSLSSRIDEQFLLVDNNIVSDVFYAVCQAHWEVGSSFEFLSRVLHLDVNWPSSFRVWHPDSHMTTGFTSKCTTDVRTYLMKALYCQLPMAVRKRVYNRCYPSVLCLYCGEVEVSDHVFSCVIDDSVRHWVLESCVSSWKAISGLFISSSNVLQLLLTCVLDFLVSSALYKSFVFRGWFREAVSVFHDPKVTGVKITDFVCSFCVAFRDNIWLVHAKHHAYIEKNGLIPVDDLVPVLVSGLVSRFSGGVVKLLGIAEAFGICFGFHKSCLFFLGIDDSVFVNIDV